MAAPTPPGEPALATRLYEQYLWSPRYVDAPILRDRDSDSDGDPGDGSLGQAGSGLDERLYYTGDVLTFSTLALVEADGDVVERYVYDPYGRARIYSGDWATDRTAAGSAYDNEIRFCGYRFDPESGLYHVRHRMYHPTLGRWLQRDPLGYVDGMGLYEYVRSVPCGLVDPKGLRLPVADPQEANAAAEATRNLGPLIDAAAQNPEVLVGGGGALGAAAPALVAVAGGVALGEALNYALYGETLTGKLYELGEALLDWYRLEQRARETAERLRKQREEAARYKGKTEKPKPPSSPQLTPDDISGKTPEEIDRFAREKGLSPRGPDPMHGQGSYTDPVTGEQRILIHDGHGHVNDPEGNRIPGPGGDPHIPILPPRE